MVSILSGGKKVQTTNETNSNTETTGGFGLASGNSGRLTFNYSETDHGAIQGSLGLVGEAVGAIVHQSDQQQAQNVRALSTLSAAFSRQADNFDGSVSTIENAAALSRQSLTGVFVLSIAAAAVFWAVRR